MTDTTRKGRCETCGGVYDTVGDMRTHLVDNPTHIAYQIDINTSGSGFRSGVAFQSPNGTLWTLSVDNSGSVVTTEL